MNFKAENWNVVVVGAWNRAILTPQWIAKNMFKVPEGTALPVEVPINVRAPMKISHDGCGVIVHSSQLEVLTENADFHSLEKAKQLSLEAVNELNRTPFLAAGFNIRFLSEGDIDPDFAELLSCKLDAKIASAGHQITKRNVTQTFPFRGGQVNLQISSSDDTATLDLNFHKTSTTAEEVTSWLQMPITEIESTTNSILENIGVTTTDL